MSAQNKLKESTIIYTIVDEAPALATHSFLPIVKAFTKGSGIHIETKDISLSGRIVAAFSEMLTEKKQQSDDLFALGKLSKKPEANIIKLPNISASIPQLKAAIRELQKQGYAIPNYPDEAVTEESKKNKSIYAKILGSAVNPVLREGNSDRRAPRAVKQYAKKNPHYMGPWNKASKTHVSTMDNHDFLHNEQSITVSKDTVATIEFMSHTGNKQILKEGIVLTVGEVVDASFMSKRALCSFLEACLQDAKEKGVLFSLHMKATMMKVSDPIIFGHAVKTYFKPVFERYQDLFESLAVNPNNGLQDVYSKIETLSQEKQDEIRASIAACYSENPGLAMVNSDKGITNLHLPSDIIIDASIPAMIRESGNMWNADGHLESVKAIIPDSSYAGVYQAVIEDCQKYGAYDPASMGSVSNVGLMAQKAEEYGSHDKTFEMTGNGVVSVKDAQGRTLLQHQVEVGDIWRMCQVKDSAIKDWVRLATRRTKLSGVPAVFWLDKNRAHDKQIIKKVELYLSSQNIEHIETHVLSPIDATRHAIARIRQGLDTISVTGNVLRDYNTDLFPILELGTSAKMLSIVPLMNGGRLFETGAGGSAPKHVQQFQEEGHLRWDSLGEFLALAASLEHVANTTQNKKAGILAETLDQATAAFLDARKSPSRKVGELDNRGSHFYLALYWAEALAKQTKDNCLQERFVPFYKALDKEKDNIIACLNDSQGSAQDLGGYYRPNSQKVQKAMRPSKVFNDALLVLENIILPVS